MIKEHLSQLIDKKLKGISNIGEIGKLEDRFYVLDLEDTTVGFGIGPIHKNLRLYGQSELEHKLTEGSNVFIRSRLNPNPEQDNCCGNPLPMLETYLGEPLNDFEVKPLLGIDDAELNLCFKDFHILIRAIKGEMDITYNIDFAHSLIIGDASIT